MPLCSRVGRKAVVAFSLACGAAACGLPVAWSQSPVEAPARAVKAAADGKPGSEAAKPAKPEDEYYDLFREFVDTFEQIDRNYVNEVDRKELMRAAIEGMVTKLDPYSSYIPPTDLADFTQGIEQEFGGIGIQVQIDSESRRLTVMTPLPGTPAYKAGVRSGDVVMEINGESTEGFTIEDAVKRLKGPAGDEVSIGVLHKGEEKVETVKLVREVIQVATVLGDRYGEGDAWDFMIDDANKIAYVRLTHFGRRTAEELRETLDKLRGEGLKGLVLDMRFNPGGLLSQAVEVCDLFLESGTIVSTKGRNVPERSYDARKDGVAAEGDFPIAVLVNRYSASASEIVGACLQDHHRAAVVGERTWGKGSVQNVIDLGGGSSALKLTTASYLRPSGQKIHRFPKDTEKDEWGVHPDPSLEIKFSDDELRNYLLDRRNRDVIGASQERMFEDRQLQAALKLLREKIAKPAGDKDGEKDEQAAPKAEPETKTGSVRKPPRVFAA